MIQRVLASQFTRFLVTGGIAAAVNLGSRFILNRWMTFSLAVVVAYLFGMATAFVLARLFVFDTSTQPLHHSAVKFALVNVAAVAQTWLVSMVLAYRVLPALGMVEHVDDLAHLVGVVVPVFTSYLGHKHWSFG